MRIGQRVVLKRGHPHAGEAGVVREVERLDDAEAIKVTLENCVHGMDSCFAFPGDWRPVK